MIKKVLSGKTKNIKYQFIRYFFCGILGLIVDFSIYYLLTFGLKLNYLIANPIAAFAGFLVVFYFNKKWVFSSSKLQNKYQEFILFFILNLISIGLGQLVLFILTEILGIHFGFSKIGANATAMLFNFITRKIFLFN